MKFCKTCNLEKPLSDFSTNGKTPNGKIKYKPICRDCNYKVQRYFVEEKTALIKKMYGTKCTICGYDRCYNALEFHHLDSDEKEFAPSKIISNFTPIETLIRELDKCVILCSNCHREVHAGLIKIQVPHQILSHSSSG